MKFSDENQLPHRQKKANQKQSSVIVAEKLKLFLSYLRVNVWRESRKSFASVVVMSASSNFGFFFFFFAEAKKNDKEIKIVLKEIKRKKKARENGEKVPGNDKQKQWLNWISFKYPLGHSFCFLPSIKKNKKKILNPKQKI